MTFQNSSALLVVSCLVLTLAHSASRWIRLPESSAQTQRIKRSLVDGGHAKWTETTLNLCATNKVSPIQQTIHMTLFCVEPKINQIRWGKIKQPPAYACCIISCLSIVVNKTSDYILIAIVRVIGFRAKDKFVCANNFSAVARSHVNDANEKLI